MYDKQLEEPYLEKHYTILIELNNTGAIRERNALSIEEISRLTRKGLEDTREYLKKLKEMDYVAETCFDNIPKYFLTKSGIITVCSIFS